MPMSALAFGLPAGAEWIIILVVALLIFGAKLPAIMRGLGGSIREFKKGVNEDPPAAATPPPAVEIRKPPTA